MFENDDEAICVRDAQLATTDLSPLYLDLFPTSQTEANRTASRTGVTPESGKIPELPELTLILSGPDDSVFGQVNTSEGFIAAQRLELHADGYIYMHSALNSPPVPTLMSVPTRATTSSDSPATGAARNRNNSLAREAVNEKTD